MAVKELFDPVGEAVVRWYTAEEGGRRSGLPTGPVYTATAVFVLGGESEVQPDWPLSADPKITVWVELVEPREDRSWLCKIDFPFRDLAVPYLSPGGEFLIMEGPNVVARARFTDIYEN